MAITWTKLIPRWGGDTIEPPEAKKDTGYIAGDKPPAKWENWLRKGTYEALDETRDVVEGIDSQLAQTAKTYIKNTRPTQNDDETLDYKQGDVWIYEDYTDEEDYTYEAYKCLDARDGFSKWEKFAEDVAVPPKVYGVSIDLTNSNPQTSVTYTDDAVGMVAGSSDWDTFFGHKPCLFKDGVVVGYLNPNNFAQFEDGSPADITSGNAGDVMIEFPRRGLKIETIGNTLTIKMTDAQDDVNFEYLAHTKGSTRKEKFYLGSYKGFKDGSNKLRSLSGKTPTATQTIGTFRTQAQANGAGYEQSGFYQLIFRQAMYLLKYKNLNSQVAVGRGYVDGNSAAINTGGTNAKGMDFGETTGKLQMKLFGLEDFWGNIREWIDGLFSNSTRNLLTATDNFNDTGSGYTDHGQGSTATIGNYMSKPQGTTKTGFIIKEVTGSETTYFCDSATLTASCLPNFGGNWNSVSTAGAFCLLVDYSASSSYAYLGGRLMYL